MISSWLMVNSLMIIRLDEVMDNEERIAIKKREIVIINEYVQILSFLWGEIFLIISNIINNIIWLFGW